MLRKLSVGAATVPTMSTQPDLVLALEPELASTMPVHAGAAIAQEMVDRAIDELPALACLADRERLLAATWLTSLRSARTRRAYSADLRGWLGWLAERELDVLNVSRVHVELWVAQQTDVGAEASSVRRRLSAVASFYRFATGHDLLSGLVPTDGVTRPAVDPDYTSTVGLDRDQTRALLAAADTDTGPRAPRTAALIRLLVTTGLRVDELTAADVTDLSIERGHRVVRVIRKGSRKARLVIPPTTWSSLEIYLADRANRAGLTHWSELRGPLLATDNHTPEGGRMRQSHLWELVRRLARAAGLEYADKLSPHSLRHTAITLALDAGVPLRDVQDYAGHRDPRTTRRYDHTRHNLDRSVAYTIAAYLG
jgi:site-specific recombinase XerD